MHILADIEGFGRIYECWDCPNIHLQVGPVNITLARDAYMQLVAIVNTSAANYELSIQTKAKLPLKGDL